MIRYRFIYPPHRGGRNFTGDIGSVHPSLTDSFIKDWVYKAVKSAQDDSGTPTSLKTAIELYLERHSSFLARSGETDWRVLGSFHVFIGVHITNLKDVTPGMIEDFKAMRSKEVAPGTVNRELSIIKSMFTKCVHWQLLDKSPAAHVSRLKDYPTKTRFLTQDEVGRLYAVLDKSDGYLKDIVILARETGLRMGELIGIKPDSVDFVNRTLRVVNTKSNRIETIPLNGAALTVLVKYPHGLFFIRTYTLRRAFNKAVKEAGITDLTFHDLRHDFGSRLVMSGAGIETAKELLRHKSISTTTRYCHLDQEHLRRAVEGMK